MSTKDFFGKEIWSGFVAQEQPDVYVARAATATASSASATACNVTAAAKRGCRRWHAGRRWRGGWDLCLCACGVCIWYIYK